MKQFVKGNSVKYLKKAVMMMIAAVILLLSVSASADSWTCSCGHSGNTGNYCPICGRSRSAGSSWTCPGCGRVNLAGYNYCENCGTLKPAGEQWALATMKLAINDGPGTSRYFNELGTYNVAGQMVRVFAKSWDTDNDIWWIKCEIPGTNHVIGWTGLKRFDQSTFDLDALPVVTYDRRTRRYVN